MKKSLGSIISLFALTFSSYGHTHPGRTYSDGGHTCRTNCPKWGLDWGEYHYHGGSGRRSYQSDSYDAPLSREERLLLEWSEFEQELPPGMAQMISRYCTQNPNPSLGECLTRQVKKTINEVVRISKQEKLPEFQKDAVADYCKDKHDLALGDLLECIRVLTQKSNTILKKIKKLPESTTPWIQPSFIYCSSTKRPPTDTLSCMHDELKYISKHETKTKLILLTLESPSLEVWQTWCSLPSPASPRQMHACIIEKKFNTSLASIPLENIGPAESEPEHETAPR